MGLTDWRVWAAVAVAGYVAYRAWGAAKGAADDLSPAERGGIAV